MSLAQWRWWPLLPAALGGGLLWWWLLAPFAPPQSLTLTEPHALLDQPLTLNLDAAGQAAVDIPLDAISVQPGGFLVIRGTGLQPLERIILLRQRQPLQSPLFHDQTRDPITEQMMLPSFSGAQLWIPLWQLKPWEGTITRLAFGFYGQPEQRIQLDAVELQPATWRTRLAALTANWARASTWDQSSINQYRGQTDILLARLRLLLVGAWLIASLLLYGLWVGVRRCPPDWRIPALLALIGWLVLDVTWQWDLGQRLEQTRTTFRNQTDETRRLNAPDGALYALVEQVKAQIDSPTARVFVAAGDDFTGMRANYFLYPLNPFWQRGGPELPAASQLATDDYVLMIAASSVRYNPIKRQLHWPPQQARAVEPVWATTQGALYRVVAQ